MAFGGLLLGLFLGGFLGFVWGRMYTVACYNTLKKEEEEQEKRIGTWEDNKYLFGDAELNIILSSGIRAVKLKDKPYVDFIHPHGGTLAVGWDAIQGGIYTYLTNQGVTKGFQLSELSKKMQTWVEASVDEYKQIIKTKKEAENKILMSGF